MSNITEQLMSQIGEGGLESMAAKIGADKGQVASALEGMIPTMLKAISGNTANAGGASGFLSALDRDHDGSILDDVAGFLQNPQSGNGAGILKHVLGDNKSNVEGQLAASSGLPAGSMGSLMEMVAPLIMGYLGKQKKESSGGFGLDDISGLLGSLSGGKGFDIGSIIEMVGGGGGNTQSKSKSKTSAGGLLGILGNLFGKK